MVGYINTVDQSREFEILKDKKWSKVKNLILCAWRERWTDYVWGVRVRSLAPDELKFLAESINQLALIGPGPNHLVLSYLKQSVFSHLIPTSSVLRSISQYQAFYKPFCVTSLLELLDQIKDRLITRSIEDDGKKCLELALSVHSIILWLLSVMYFSLEKISDMTDLAELPSEVEDSKIVTKCRKLMEYLANNEYIKGLIYIASLEVPSIHENIRKMCRENLKFCDGFHGNDIRLMISLFENFNWETTWEQTRKNLIGTRSSSTINKSIQIIIMNLAIFQNSSDFGKVVDSLIIIKQIKNFSDSTLYSDVIHSAMVGLADSIGKEYELKFIGFVFLQLPLLLKKLREKLMNSEDEFSAGLEKFLINESSLDLIDSKLHSGAWELFLRSLVKKSLLTDAQKEYFFPKKSFLVHSQKKVSPHAVFMLKDEITVTKILRSLDGDYLTQQDKIYTVISSIITGETFELILITASSTGLLPQVISKFLKLNQMSRKVNGEISKASITRAMIFDSTFIALWYIGQNYGMQDFPEGDDIKCFFERWCSYSMFYEGTGTKSPELILSKCDPNKVDLLLNQYWNSDSELKTSLVYWHELCTNSVGVVADLLFAWNNGGSITFSEIKKILDVFRSKICALPICISSYLCSYIITMPEGQSEKAKLILEYLLSPITPLPSSDDTQDNFKDRRRLMENVINKMISSHNIKLRTSSHDEIKDCTDLFEAYWKTQFNGTIDFLTTVKVKNFLDMVGSGQFLKIAMKRMFELQHSFELSQWIEIVYGVVNFNLEKSAKALLTEIIPGLFVSTENEFNCHDAQVFSLISFLIDIILSYNYHLKTQLNDGKIKLELEDIGGESLAKRRKLTHTSKEKEVSELDKHIVGLYKVFGEVLFESKDETPMSRFIFNFLKELVNRATHLSVCHSTTSNMINCLIGVLGNTVEVGLIVSLYSLKNSPKARRDCAQSICILNNYNHQKTAIDYN